MKNSIIHNSFIFDESGQLKDVMWFSTFPWTVFKDLVGANGALLNPFSPSVKHLHRNVFPALKILLLSGEQYNFLSAGLPC